ncbi:Uncharacterised protein [Mycobacteroides abscessus subsp. abscessus]|nr:Uncharacterised protein [Mycobacteroides abscessus subsp. abscessus]SKX40344.1 Uncharacterised protein [Mycobacteroides abscessus subsp. abscessus]SLG68499.1 Uncharacterised protein [Mycobacteroides abscessus subsp. abscessus]
MSEYTGPAQHPAKPPWWKRLIDAWRMRRYR